MKNIKTMIIGLSFLIISSLVLVSLSNKNLKENTVVFNNNVKKVENKQVVNKANIGNRLSRGSDIADNKEENVQAMNNLKGVVVATDKTIVKTAKIENLDWFNEAQFVYPIGAVAEIEDLATGKRFKMQRTFGTNHADVEALTKEDSKIIKEIWGGDYSWERRPVIVNINNRRIAASLAAMPHAGNDSYEALSIAPNLSGGYGEGQNLDVVKNNDMDGVCDLHFLNSKRHADGPVEAVVDPEHQRCIEMVMNSK